jgi:hypothetical protein
MSGVIEFLILLLLATTPFIAMATARFMAEGQWHTRYRHSCGHTDRHIHSFPSYRVCKKCGERGGKYTEIITRAKFPLGWEVKEKQ